MNMMSNQEECDSMELIQKAKELGILDSNLTVKCVQCNAIFPKEYHKCPRCQTDQSSQTTKFSMTVTWE
jgi:uncharacterized paraquat-inducible protein A